MKTFLYSQGFIFSALLFCMSCEQPSNTVILKGENGKIIEKYETSGDSIRNGLSERFDEDGNLRSTEIYLNGLLNGERTIYYPTGEKQIIEHYILGDFEGQYQFYFQSGQLELEGSYRKNEMIGDWKRYYENGQLQEIVRFEGNEENGPFIEYYENGLLKAEGQYYHGDNEHGLLKLYDESGELYRKMECDSGKCHTIWKRADQD